MDAEELAKAVASLDRVLHEKMRLAIATALYHRGKADFTYLKRLLKTSEGNLATHLRTLEQAGYVRVEKRFVGRRPQTLYELTEKGKRAYREYVKNLAKLAREIA